MKKSEFIKEISEYCEFEVSDIQMDTELRSMENYNSLTILSIIAFADENFGKRLSAQQIHSLTDMNSLVRLIGINKFEND
ncbi:MAG TPA: acyl carrier protein [Ignavibacteria bacterium]